MENIDTLKIIGQNIQKARLNKNITQEYLAEKCGVSSNHISMLERGLSSGSISLIMNICNTLEVSPNFIFKNTISSCTDNIKIMSDDIATTYLKLKEENKSFVNQTINHLYFMQKKR